MQSARRYVYLGSVIGLAALALLGLALAASPARADGWDASSIMVDVDDTYLYSGDTLSMTVTGSDNDGNESNNLLEFDLRLETSSGSVVASWTDQVIGTQDEVMIGFTIPQSLRSGAYYARVYEPGETQTLDSAYLYISQRPSVALEVYDSTLYQGDTMNLLIEVANESVDHISLVINASDGTKTVMAGSLAVSLGENYFNWSVPRSLRAGSYYVEAYILGDDLRSAYVRVTIYRPYFYHNAVLSQGKYSSSLYAPGEVVTVHLYGEPEANYTVNVSKDTDVMKSWTTVRLDAGGQTNLTLNIPLSAGDGTYSITMTAEDGTEFTVEYMTVQMFLIALYPERSEFLEGESFSVFYTVRNLMDGSLATSASGTWQLYQGSRNVVVSGTFSTPSGSFQVQLPNTGNYPDYTLRVWYNDTGASRSTYSSTGISTGPLSFSIDSDESTYAPGGVVVLSLRTAVGSSYYSAPAPGVPITMVKVFTRKSGGQWSVDSSYTIQPSPTDAMGRSQLVMIIAPSTADLTEFRVDATAAKDRESRNDSAYFNVRVSSDISATIRLDRTAYTAGQTMHITVATHAPNVTGQLTYTYRIVAGSVYSSSSRVLLVKTSPSPTIDWEIPADLEGTVYIYVSISGPNGASGGTSTNVPVHFGSLAVNASPATFRANATIRISYTYTSAGTETPQLFCRITDSDGNMVLERQLSGGRSGGFDFKVPAAASEEYDIRMFAYRDGRMLATGSLTIQREHYYTLELTVDKDTVSPGEMVRISYRVVRHGNAPAVGEPATIRYGDITLQNEFQTSGMEGSFEYRVPDGATEGPFTIHVAWSPSDSDMGAYSSATITATRAPAGLAMGRADVLLLSLALIALLLAIMGVLMVRRLSKRMGSQGAPPEYRSPEAPVPPSQPERVPPPPQPAQQPPPPEVQRYFPPPQSPTPPQGQPPAQGYQPPPQPQPGPVPQPQPVAPPQSPPQSQSSPQPAPPPGQPPQPAPSPAPQPQPQPQQPQPQQQLKP